MVPPPPAVEVRGVSVSRGGSPALEEVHLSVERGDLLAVVGPNGSGKSTLLQIALGLLKPDRGEVRLFGTPLGEFQGWSRVVYVPQGAAHASTSVPASVEEVVSLGLLPERGLFPRPRRGDGGRIEEALKSVGLERFGKRVFSRLSGGERQRVHLARALVARPDLLVLDEPTVGVDLPAQEVFYGLLERMNRDLGTTVILVTHDVGVVHVHMKHVACLNRTLRAHGPPSCLQDPKVLEATFGHHAGLVLHPEGEHRHEGLREGG